jgi:hypothetical protein
LKTQYSILSVLIRPEIQEKISIGLLLFDESEVIFNYSDNKLNVSKDLLSDTSYKILKDVIKALDDKFNETFNLYSIKKGIKIFNNKNFENSFSAEYIEYLSKYSNNLIGFSSPKPINLNVNPEIYDSLFNKFVDLSQAEKAPKERLKPIEIIRERHKEILSYYNINNEISHNYIPNLIAPVRIDFSGQNGIDVYAQTLDMEQPYNHVAYHVNAFAQLKSAYLESGKEMKDFIIAKEPPKHLKKQHDIWEQVRNLKKFNYLDISESQQIIDYAVEKNVKPLVANYAFAIQSANKIPNIDNISSADFS